MRLFADRSDLPRRPFLMLLRPETVLRGPPLSQPARNSGFVRRPDPFGRFLQPEDAAPTLVQQVGEPSRTRDNWPLNDQTDSPAIFRGCSGGFRCKYRVPGQSRRGRPLRWGETQTNVLFSAAEMSAGRAQCLS